MLTRRSLGRHALSSSLSLASSLGLIFAANFGDFGRGPLAPRAETAAAPVEQRVKPAPSFSPLPFNLLGRPHPEPLLAVQSGLEIVERRHDSRCRVAPRRLRSIYAADCQQVLLRLRASRGTQSASRHTDRDHAPSRTAAAC